MGKSKKLIVMAILLILTFLLGIPNGDKSRGAY